MSLEDMANHIASFSNLEDPDYALPVDKIPYKKDQYANDKYMIYKDRYIVSKDYQVDNI